MGPARPRAPGGWTGGQYSLVRVLAGATFAAGFAGALLGEPPPGIRLWLRHAEAVFAASCAAGLLASVAFASGWHDRMAAVVLAASVGLRLAADSEALGLGGAWVFVFLSAHLFVRSAPYGSIEALGRADPRGGWTTPAPVRTAAWLALAAGNAVAAWAGAPHGASRMWVPFAILPFAGAHGPEWTPSGLGLALCGAALHRWLRPWAWCALLALTCAWGLARGTFPLGPLLLLALALEPHWVAPRPLPSSSVLFYDGACGLCHRAVRFVLAEEQEPGGLRFAPLQGATFRRLLNEKGRHGLPDSLVLLERGSPVRLRSEAVMRLLEHCGGLWRLLALLGRLVPVRLRDALYDGVARVRHRLFPPPQDWCPVAPEFLRARFER